MIVWENSSLDDCEAVFEFLYEFNPLAAEKTDAIIEKKVKNLNQQPLMGVFQSSHLLRVFFFLNKRILHSWYREHNNNNRPDSKFLHFKLAVQPK